MHYVVIGNHIENAPSTIVRPSWSFNFHSSEIDFFKICGAHFISNERRFSEIFGTYADLFVP